MNSLRRFLKKVIPLPLISYIRRIRHRTPEFKWFKSYGSWEIAKKNASGYDEDRILEKCKTALLKVRDGLAAYERDSVLFDKIEYSWGLLAILQRAAIENNNELCVLDFGGSLGSSFFQNKDFLSSLSKIKWCIVEQPNFVSCGKENFENENLKFYYTIEDCLKENKPQVLVLSSVLQYLEEPFEWIKKFNSIGIPYIVVDRLSFIKNSYDVPCVQNVPEFIYKASYPCWFFEKEKFTTAFTGHYELLGYFNSGYTPPMKLDGKTIYWEGLILKK
ncbi:methyltransferase, TIGR04325 family [Pedobacter sp.]|uniref:methyltransferase, TIGR04325 family n=1 Tax=Pedobacter sp. TaxID=1411316 RepID=UPI0031CE0632